MPDVTHSFAWNVNKENNAPLGNISIYLSLKKKYKTFNILNQVKAYDPIDTDELKNHLKEQVHGATTEIIKATDFTSSGYLPKCFLPYYSPPGQLPRKVQIDRFIN